MKQRTDAERMQYNLKIYTEKMVKQLSLGYIASKYNKQVWIKRYLKKMKL